MKKVLVFFMVLVFTLSMTLNVLAVPGKGNNGKGNGNGGNKSETQTVSTSDSDVSETSGKIWSNKPGNLVKLYTDDGKKVMFPVHALLNNGATNVVWDGEAGTVTVTGTNGVTVVFTPGGKTASVDAAVAIDKTTALITGAITEGTNGTATGTVTCTVTNPLTGEPMEVVLDLADGALTNIVSAATDPADPANLTITSADLAGTISGDIVDPVTLAVLGSVTGTVGGTLAEPEFTIGATTAFAVDFESEESNGRAYVPIQDLDKLFATQLAGSTTTETTPTEPAPEVVPEVVPEV